MATIRICNEGGCQRKHMARGLCKRHWDQLNRAGGATGRVCAIGECDRVREARGLCARHYEQLSDAGATTGKTCATVGCDRGHSARGLCARHYEQLRRVEARARRSHPERRTAPSPAPVPDLPQTDLEARQRALIRAMVKSASETTTWDPLQYLAELLSDAEDVRDVRSSWTPTAWSRSEQ